MLATNLRCLECARALPLEYVYSCPECGGALDVVYSYADLSSERALSIFLANPSPGIARYSELLPIRTPSRAISLGEGGTELVPARQVGNWTTAIDLYVKNESTNPTASFKDRPLSVAATCAREAGLDTLVVASSGNAAAAAAAFAARGGMRCIVLVPETTPSAKIAQTLAYGAQAVRVRGTYSECLQLARTAAQGRRWANVTTTYVNPYTIEGDKTVAYELLAQFGGSPPEYVIVPIGAGPLLAGIQKGFLEMKVLGLCKTVPAMVGVQAQGCAPIASAFERGAEEASEWGESVETIASAIADPLRGYARDGAYTLRAIRSSGGVALAVSDGEIAQAGQDLAMGEGLFLEPAAVAPLAAARRLAAQGWFREGSKVVLVATGHGLKDPSHAAGETVPTPVIDARFTELERLFPG